MRPLMSMSRNDLVGYLRRLELENDYLNAKLDQQKAENTRLSRRIHQQRVRHSEALVHALTCPTTVEARRDRKKEWLLYGKSKVGR